MRRIFLCGLSSALCLTLSAIQAQETNDVEALRQQLIETQKKFNRDLREHQQTIDELNQRLNALPQAGTNRPPPSAVDHSEPNSDGVSAKAWNPADPIRLGKGNAYMDIGMVATFAAGGSTARDIEAELELGGHDPNQRGFTVQGVEATFSGAVDPYFRGFSTINFQIDAEGESALELEEAYLESLSLPANLQLRAGEYFTEFGRHNPTHVHAWGFVDTPLVNGRLLGPDGLHNPGARLAWLAPTPFYSELTLGVQNSQGETATSFRSDGGHHHGGEDHNDVPFAFRESENDRGVSAFDDLLIAPRYAISFDLTDEQTVLAGASAAFGPNSSGKNAGDTRTQIYGLDFLWKWKPVRSQGGFPFVSWQTEGMWRRYDAGRFDWDLNGDGLIDDGEIADPNTGAPALLAGERLDDYGLYSQVLYGFRKGWVAGFRVDHVASREGDYEKRGLMLNGEALGRDESRAARWRLSPNLTWYPTEFSKFRLQYNYDDRRGVGEDHSVWLQFEFILGAHAAHTF